MIGEHQQEQAALYALGALRDAELRAFEAEVRGDAGLRAFVRELQRATEWLALSAPALTPPSSLRERVLNRIPDTRAAEQPAPTPLSGAFAGLRFLEADNASGWKALPVPGAWIKLLSLDPARGYAVLLGRLEAGVRYPAHLHTAPEDIYVLTGDLHIGERRLGPGDFHHADAGSQHGVNYSADGCTLLAVMSPQDPLVELAMA